MRKEILDMCPDCGGDLDGDICVECDIKWYFLGKDASVENSELNKTGGKNDEESN